MSSEHSLPQPDPRTLSERPTRMRAVALRHQLGAEAAPQVTAKGDGEIAQRILDVARKNGVPVREDRDLLELLSRCDVGATIPGELFEVVARLLAHLYRLNRDVRERDVALPPR
ncbi:MAG: EscU/YscU/HrcU family type III secretion system export apparatus switch protein [Planctomycetota bacterium]